MRYYPDSEYDWEEVKVLGVLDWQLDALKMNPEYCSWGPHEDYMMKKESSGWEAPVFFDSWDEFSWSLDDLNELVNFYFQVTRDSIECEECGGEGYNPETGAISDAFYNFDYRGQKWADNITQDEVDALWEEGRLRRWKERPTAAEVNATGGNVHDAINRWILIETRAKRLGVWGKCEECAGRGEIFTEPIAHLEVVMWMIHPRKGASRGVEIGRVEMEQVKEVVEYLMEAADRNAQRFGRLQ
jgi:hypothetical protein